MVGAVMMVVKVAMIVAERETASLVLLLCYTHLITHVYTHFDPCVTLILVIVFTHLSHGYLHGCPRFYLMVTFVVTFVLTLIGLRSFSFSSTITLVVNFYLSQRSHSIQ